MKTKALLMASLSVAAIGSLAGANPASAAKITQPASGQINFGGDAVIDFDAAPPPFGTFNIDFLPTGGTSGDLISTSATGCTGSFAGFCAGATAATPKVFDIADISFLNNPAGGALSVDNFIKLDSNDVFNLRSFSPLQFSPSTVNGQPSTAASISVDGFWTTEDGIINPGTGIFTLQFVGQTPEQVSAQFLSGTAFEKSFSANFDIRPAQITSVPESSTLGGLTVVAGSVLLLGLKKKSNS